MKQKQIVQALVVAGVLTAGLVADASATSVIDTTMKTALTSGFTDLMDTVKDVISSSWQVVIGATVLLAAPGLVQRLIHKATGK